MNLKIIGSNSSGNAYLLENDTESLLIECGVRFDKIKQAAGFKLNKIQGCLLSHLHGDHSHSAQAVMNAGIDVYSSEDTFKGLGLTGHRCKAIKTNVAFKIGGFRVKAFECKHDVTCYGFLVEHEDTGLICFLTDTYYCEYRFRGVDHFIVEANYSEAILDEKTGNGTIKFVRDRVIQSHFSIENCRDFLLACDLSKTKSITLIHLSNAHSDELAFMNSIEEATGKPVHVADAGMTIQLNKNPF